MSAGVTLTDARDTCFQGLHYSSAPKPGDSEAKTPTVGRGRGPGLCPVTQAQGTGLCGWGSAHGVGVTCSLGQPRAWDSALP